MSAARKHEPRTLECAVCWDLYRRKRVATTFYYDEPLDRHVAICEKCAAIARKSSATASKLSKIDVTQSNVTKRR